MKIINAPALSRFARTAADQLPIFISVVRNLIGDVRDSYRPTPAELRGPGPKWPRKNRPLLNVPTRSTISMQVFQVVAKQREASGSEIGSRAGADQSR